MHDHARVHLFTLTTNVAMHIYLLSFINHTVYAWPMTAKFNIFLFSPLDLRTSSGAPEQELNLHTTFGKFAKRLEHLSADLPLWIIELSVREWRTGSKRGPREISGISRNSQNYGLCGTRIKLRSG